MTPWHWFQAAIWIAIVATNIQWQWTEPIAAWVIGGMVAWYATGLASALISGLKRLYPRKEPAGDQFIAELLSTLDAGRAGKIAGPDGGGRLIEGTLSEPGRNRLGGSAGSQQCTSGDRAT